MNQDRKYNNYFENILNYISEDSNMVLLDSYKFKLFFCVLLFLFVPYVISLIVEIEDLGD